MTHQPRSSFLSISKLKSFQLLKPHNSPLLGNWNPWKSRPWEILLEKCAEFFLGRWPRGDWTRIVHSLSWMQKHNQIHLQLQIEAQIQIIRGSPLGLEPPQDWEAKPPVAEVQCSPNLNLWSFNKTLAHPHAHFHCFKSKFKKLKLKYKTLWSHPYIT